jgi:replicative DNA helicase
MVEPTYLRSPILQTVYWGWREALLRGRWPVELDDIAELLTAERKLQAVGGRALLAELATIAPSAANVTRWAGHVVDDWARREQLSALMVAAHEANMGAKTPLEAFAIARQRVEAAVTIDDDIVPSNSAINKLAQRMESRMSGDKRSPIAKWGIQSIDAVTGGLYAGEMVIVAARPSMGKSAMVLNTALRCGAPVAFFSLEMLIESIYWRAMGCLSGVPMTRIHEAQIQPEERQTLWDAHHRFGGMPIYLSDKGPYQIDPLVAKIASGIKRFGWRVIIIDYLQLLDGRKSDTRAQEIGSISRALKRLASEHQVCIIALSQLNRGLESRGDKTPMISDLRESGDIEQDADVIALIYRESYYTGSSDLDAQVIIGKNREGAIGRAQCTFDRAKCRFF